MPYTTEALIWLTYAHFLIFLVPAMGLGIALLRDDWRKRRTFQKDAAVHHAIFTGKTKKRAA